MATRSKKKVIPPTVVVGSHLTVTTHSDGTTELKWDDDALHQEVLTAVASYEATLKKPARKTRTKKSAD